MPLPKPNSTDNQKTFLKKCMSSEVMNSEYPDQKQRAAVCYSQFRRKKKHLKEYWEVIDIKSITESLPE